MTELNPLLVQRVSSIVKKHEGCKKKNCEACDLLKVITHNATTALAHLALAHAFLKVTEDKPDPEGKEVRDEAIAIIRANCETIILTADECGVRL